MRIPLRLKEGGVAAYAIVDREDFRKLSLMKWYLRKDGYAVSSDWIDGKHVKYWMHRYIMKTPKGMDTDHKNGDRLDNRKKNLRICTRGENLRNMKGTSMLGIKGVYPVMNSKTYRAAVSLDGRQKHLGCFRTKKEAIIAYNGFVRRQFGEFARLNKI